MTLEYQGEDPLHGKFLCHKRKRPRQCIDLHCARKRRRSSYRFTRNGGQYPSSHGIHYMAVSLHFRHGADLVNVRCVGDSRRRCPLLGYLAYPLHDPSRVPRRSFISEGKPGDARVIISVKFPIG